MVQQIIETGTQPNDGLGDSVRTAGTKINENFTEVYTGVNNLQANVTALQANVTTLQANVTTLSTLPGTVNTISGRVTVIEDSYVTNTDLQSALTALTDNDSQTLSFDNSTFVLGISNVSNTVNLSPMVSGLANVTYVDSVTSNLANTQYVDNAVAGATGSILEDETTPTLTATLNANAQSIENINDVSGTGSLLLNNGAGNVLWWEDTYGSVTINSSNTASHLILANQSVGASANIGFVTSGNLYMSTAPGTNGNIVLNPSSATGNVGKVILQGATARGSGEIVFNCEFNSHGITLKGPPHSANADYVMTLPTGTGNNTEVLHTDGQGNTYWAAASGGGGGGGATDMASLTDVDSVDTVATGDMLLYDGSKYGFVNFQQETQAYVTAGLSNISVANLSNVDSNDTPVTGDMLLHDGSEFKYVNYENEITTRIGASSINALSDVDTTTVAPVADYGLVWDADNSRWEPQAIYVDTLDTVVTRGSTANSDITINGQITVNTLETTGVGTPVIESWSEIILRPTTRVDVQDGPIRPANLTETQRDAISALTGDIITNANTSTLQVYDGSSWTNLGGSGGGSLNDVVDDGSPQLGGDLDTNGNNIQFWDSTGATVNRLQLGASQDAEMYFDGTHTWITHNGGTASSLIIQNLNTDTNTTDAIRIETIDQNSALDHYIHLANNAGVRLGVNGSDRISVIGTGAFFNTNIIMNGSGREIHYRDTTGNGDYLIKLVPEQINDSDKTITIPNATGTMALQGDPISHTFNVTNNGLSDYTFSDTANHWFPTSENDPILYLRRGETYNFVLNASGHPFEIRVSNGGSAYSTGVTNNATAVGTVTFKVPMSAPATLYYQCTSHSGLGNTINIV